MSRKMRIGALAIGLLLGFGVLILAKVMLLEPEASLLTARFGDVSLKLDLATTTVARERGLGGRTDVPEGYGMLFVFSKEGSYGFWMKDTLVPLDIFWLDSQGHVVSMAQRVEPASYPDVFYPTEPVRYVLETRAGFAAAHGVATGTPLLLKNFPTVSE